MDLEENNVEKLDEYTETKKLGLFEIKEDMPDELKQKLEKFNRQTRVLNQVIDDMNIANSKKAENIEDEDEDDIFGDYSTDASEDDSIEDDSIEENDDMNLNEMKDLF